MLRLVFSCWVLLLRRQDLPDLHRLVGNRLGGRLWCSKRIGVYSRFPLLVTGFSIRIVFWKYGNKTYLLDRLVDNASVKFLHPDTLVH